VSGGRGLASPRGSVFHPPHFSGTFYGASVAPCGVPERPPRLPLRGPAGTPRSRAPPLRPNACLLAQSRRRQDPCAGRPVA